MTWDTSATKQSIEKAADKISTAVKDGAKDTVDAIKRIATTNAAGGTSAPVSAIHTGLRSVATSAKQIAEYLVTHPDEMHAATEAGEAVGRQFSELVKSAVEFAEGSERLTGMTDEMKKTADWVGERFPGRAGNQGGTPMSINNAFTGGVFNPGAIAPPCVGGFADLPGQ